MYRDVMVARVEITCLDYDEPAELLGAHRAPTQGKASEQSESSEIGRDRAMRENARASASLCGSTCPSWERKRTSP